MNIVYSANSRIFWLDTQNTTYAMMVDRFGDLIHLYYGSTIAQDSALAEHARHNGRTFCTYPDMPGAVPRDTINIKQLEYTSFGAGDFHLTACRITSPNGAAVSHLVYKSHCILTRKSPLPGLPQTHGGQQKSLEITLVDEFSGAEVILRYTVFQDSDAIVRSVRFLNPTKEKLSLENAVSVHLPFNSNGFELICAASQYGEERWLNRMPLHDGIQAFRSNRGATGHQYNPSLVLATPATDENHGEAYAVFLVYSGSFAATIEVDELHATRVMLGINDETFRWQLKPGEFFDTPEAILVFSDSGLNDLSNQCHRLIMEHIIRSLWKHRKRPILINNWEGTYFDFDDEKLYNIAKAAAKLNIEMLVLDDGWFGQRNFSDHSGLGDWHVNTNKIRDFKGLLMRINALGLKFGLWFEPEMVNEDSDLYRAHPDWVLQVPNKPRSLGRAQLVLDFSRSEVVDEIFKMMCIIIGENNIEYIKWDCNRNLSECFSNALPPEQQGEVYHRYILGVYSLHEKLIQAFPDLLIEGCSGGGGRYDAGMLYYVPQIWCSDTSDAVHRIRIQLGTSLIYPSSTMGAHVSASPNHQTGQTAPLEFRGHIALAGTFGYELDPCKLTEEEQDIIREQVKIYHQYNDLIREGSFYRLTEKFGDSEFSAWEWVTRDQSEALIMVARTFTRSCWQNDTIYLKCAGLEPAHRYQIEGTENICHGSTLMNAGINLFNQVQKQPESMLIHLIQVSTEEASD